MVLGRLPGAEAMLCCICVVTLHDDIGLKGRNIGAEISVHTFPAHMSLVLHPRLYSSYCQSLNHHKTGLWLSRDYVYVHA